MYALGDKFDLKGLKQEARERFVARLDDPYSDCIQATKESSSKPLPGGWLIAEFIAVIPLIYATTPGTDCGLRDLATEFGRARWKRLWAQPAFKNALTEIGDFINDVVTVDRAQVYPSGW